MTQPGDPPASPGSGRSIYERLGLTPTPNVQVRKAPMPPQAPRGRRTSLRLGLVVLLIFGALITVWAALSIDQIQGLGRARTPLTTDDESERRMDKQDSRIKALEMRTEMLEVKVRALQELNGYQGVKAGDRRHAPPPDISAPD